MLGLFATASAECRHLYQFGQRPRGSINFVTCHDGFTLNDMVSYRYKHNEANGENNHDGTTPTSARTMLRRRNDGYRIETLRKRQIKNFF